MTSAQELLSGKIRLPSPPAIAIKILETVRNDNFTFEDLAGVIISDPALAARVLKAANSPYYSQSGKITSIEKALALLGTHSVMNIALSFVICSEFQGERFDTFDATIFWRRAVTAAVAAELSATLVDRICADIFITALLQDVGIMVMHSYRPFDYQQVLVKRRESHRSLPEIEREIFGCDHQEVGAELLKSWLLPEDIYEPIRNHHREQLVSDKYHEQTSLLCIADNLSSFYNGSQDVNKIRLARKIFDSEFGIQGKAIDTLIESAASKSLEVLSSFDISPGSLRPFSQILQEANEGLSQLYDSSELQVIELKQAKQKLEQQAQELKSANEKLRELASRDGLTGVFNFRAFHEVMDREIVRSQRYGSQFSLIFFDVDDLKKINDVSGHPVGDLVLVEICRAVSKTIRAADTLARLGGDEFAVIMPETNNERVTTVAEHVRNCVDDLSVRVANGIIKANISIGFASYDPSNKTLDKKQIILMADNALLTAKSAGKNRIFAMQTVQE